MYCRPGTCVRCVLSASVCPQVPPNGPAGAAAAQEDIECVACALSRCEQVVSQGLGIWVYLRVRGVRGRHVPRPSGPCRSEARSGRCRYCHKNVKSIAQRAAAESPAREHGIKQGRQALLKVLEQCPRAMASQDSARLARISSRTHQQCAHGSGGGRGQEQAACGQMAWLRTQPRTGRAGGAPPISGAPAATPGREPRTPRPPCQKNFAVKRGGRKKRLP